MANAGTIEIGLRSYPYALPNYPILTTTGGIPPAFNNQDFHCSLKTAHRVNATGFPIHDASLVLSPQGIIATNVGDPTGSSGDILTDAAMIGDYMIYFPNSTTGASPTIRPFYSVRRNLFNVGTPGAGEPQFGRISAPGNYFANSGQRPFAMNPYRFALTGTQRLAGKAMLAHSFEDTAGPDNINPTYVFSNAPLSFTIPLEVDLPGSDILGGYQMYGCPYGEWDFVFLDKSTAPAGVVRKQLNWYRAVGFVGETTRNDSVLNVFADYPALHAIWSQNPANTTNTYRVNIWPFGWTVLFYTNGTGPNGPAQKFELAIMDPFMMSYALVKFVPVDDGGAQILANWVHGSGDIKLDDQGIYWLHNGRDTGADELTVITSFNVSPFDFPRVAPIQLPPVTLPCFAPCGPFTIPGNF